MTTPYCQQPLTLARVLQWHFWLFPSDSSLIQREQIVQRVQGGQLRGDAPIQVVSGRIDRPKVHFEAPPRQVLESQLHCFIDYYDVFEQSQKGTTDITAWLVWFLDTLAASLRQALTDIKQTLQKTGFWQQVDQTRLSQEQVKVLNRLLDGDFSGGISNSQYGKVAKVSPATASHHMAQLVGMGCLVKTAAGGMSTRYLVPIVP